MDQASSRLVYAAQGGHEYVLCHLGQSSAKQSTPMHRPVLQQHAHFPPMQQGQRRLVAAAQCWLKHHRSRRAPLHMPTIDRPAVIRNSACQIDSASRQQWHYHPIRSATWLDRGCRCGSVQSPWMPPVHGWSHSVQRASAVLNCRSTPVPHEVRADAMYPRQPAAPNCRMVVLEGDGQGAEPSEQTRLTSPELPL